MKAKLPEHQDRRRPVRRRRPAEVDRPRQGDHPGQPEPQGHLRRQRRLDHRRAQRRQGTEGGKIVVIGYDSGKQQKDAIRSGLEAGAITQNPVGIGYKRVEAAVKAIKGETLPKIIDTGFYWYDKTNIDDPKIAAVLYD